MKISLGILKKLDATLDQNREYLSSFWINSN